MKVLSILLLVGAFALTGIQHSALTQAKTEHQLLLRDSAEAQRLTRENGSIEELRASNQELQALREQERELLRLRDEAGQLRAKAAEASKLRAENQRLASWKDKGAKASGRRPPGFIARTALADAGLGSPEATVQTYFYALSRGDVKRAFQCNGTPFDLTPEQEQRMIQENQSLLVDFPGLSIVETNVLSAIEVQIGVQSSAGGEVFEMHLVRRQNEWIVR